MFFAALLRLLAAQTTIFSILISQTCLGGIDIYGKQMADHAGQEKTGQSSGARQGLCRY
jgi:hypothetical protein